MSSADVRRQYILEVQLSRKLHIIIGSIRQCSLRHKKLALCCRVAIREDAAIPDE
jgi:hypothetical protein